LATAQLNSADLTTEVNSGLIDRVCGIISTTMTSVLILHRPPASAERSYYRALHAYESDDPNDLTFDEGDVIIVSHASSLPCMHVHTCTDDAQCASLLACSPM